MQGGTKVTLTDQSATTAGGGTFAPTFGTVKSSGSFRGVAAVGLLGAVVVSWIIWRRCRV